MGGKQDDDVHRHSVAPDGPKIASVLPMQESFAISTFECENGHVACSSDISGFKKYEHEKVCENEPHTSTISRSESLTLYEQLKMVFGFNRSATDPCFSSVGTSPPHLNWVLK